MFSQEENCQAWILKSEYVCNTTAIQGPEMNWCEEKQIVEDKNKTKKKKQPGFPACARE